MMRNYNDMFKSILVFGSSLNKNLGKPLKGRVVEKHISDVNGFEWIDEEYDILDPVNNTRGEVKSMQHLIYTKSGSLKEMTSNITFKNVRGNSWSDKTDEEAINDICNNFDEAWFVDTGSPESYCVGKITSSDIRKYGKVKRTKDGVTLQIPTNKLTLIVIPSDIDTKMSKREFKRWKRRNMYTIREIWGKETDTPMRPLEILDAWLFKYVW